MTATTARLAGLIARLRPANAGDAAEARCRAETARLRRQPDEAAQLGADLATLLALPRQVGFYAEVGVPSALGFFLELADRLRQAVLPLPPDEHSLRSLLLRLFDHPDDNLWVSALSDEAWLELLDALGLGAKVSAGGTALRRNLAESVRVLSHRLAGTALDRELLRAEPALEQTDSPFLTQNEFLLPVLARLGAGGDSPTDAEVRHLDALLDQCIAALVRVRQHSATAGVSVRLTYLLARLEQLCVRLRTLVDLLGNETPAALAAGGVAFFKQALHAEQQRHRVGDYLAENMSLLARNVTDRASQHGEHYIASDRSAWLDMARCAAGGGVVIALMAMVKVQLALLHLPPLTEGLAFGLNYALGFVLIHLLGFVVATKQPAMTAAAIAATLEDAHPKKLDGLVELVRNVVRTQCIAVLGNVGLAVPTACLVAWLLTQASGPAAIPEGKLLHMLHDVHPWQSAALLYAAVAGVGLFLSGLVSGYFDNQAVYQRLPERVTAMPWLRGLSPARRQWLADYLDHHYGAVLGNLFFGMYLGLVGAMGPLTGLPLDIRHVAFSAANLGTATTLLDWPTVRELLPVAIIGTACIALVNLLVSFSLALHVAMLSRRLGTAQLWAVGRLLLARFRREPLSFFRPPA